MSEEEPIESVALSKRKAWWTRRRWLKAGLATGFLGGGGYSFGIEPNRTKAEKVQVPVLEAGSEPVLILHLSDLHASLSTPLSRLEEAFEEAISYKAAFCVLTGDYITQSLDHPERYAKALRRISEAMPSYAVLGNHDGGSVWTGTTGHCPPDHEAVDQLLDDAGIVRLHNRAARHRLEDGRDLMLVGTGDLWQDECDAEAAFVSRAELLKADWRKPETTVVLSHNPDAREKLREQEWDLLLSGHTHGGQVKIPFFGAPVVPVDDRRFVEGLVPWEERFVYVNRGLGSLLSLRFNCPPEIGLIELVAKN